MVIIFEFTILERAKSISLYLHANGTEAIVRTGMSSVSDPGKPEVQIVYRLRNIKDQGWKVIDVNVEGVWLVSNYRNQYGTIAAQEGIPGLIRRMQERVNNPEPAKK